MGREGRAIPGHPFATGHLQDTAGLSNESENKRTTNVWKPYHLIQQALRKTSATSHANVAYLLQDSERNPIFVQQPSEPLPGSVGLTSP